jgi:hypothetical protein
LSERDRAFLEGRLVEGHEPLEGLRGQLAQLLEPRQVLHVVHHDLLE